MSDTVFRTCPLCEATCGLELTVVGDKVTRIRGDRADVFSAGFICPKGSTLRQLEDDPDRLRDPQVRVDGQFAATTWEAAFSAIDAGLRPIIAEHGPDSVAVYLGNPNVHNMSGLLYNRVLLKALRTKNVFTASTVDQMPKHVSSGLMFGHPDIIPVPDIDRTDFLLMLGANPYASNGSLATAPDWPGRLDALRDRGGKLVVIDPRRTRTAEAADEHLFIRPGTDALFLFALVHEIFEQGLASLGGLGEHVTGIDEVAAAALAFAPEVVATTCGIEAATIRRMAFELASADRAVVYGRIGTHTVAHGTLASWLVDVLNIITGNLDRPGGAMFPRPAHERRRNRRGWSTGRWSSRVKGLPEVRGELPVATLADEIETPGSGRVRALITVAGNPLLSTPDGSRLSAALASLDFMVSIDLYRNETTSRADVILPATSPLQRSHYDFAFYGLSVRNIANYSPPVLQRLPGQPDEWEVLLTLAGIAAGMGHSGAVDMLDDLAFRTLVESETSDPDSMVAGRDPAELARLTRGGRGPERMLDFLLRTGPYGDGFGSGAGDLDLERLMDNPHGIDLGALEPRVPEILATSSGTIEMAPALILDDVPRLAALLDGTPPSVVLIGRRDLRSNNSWMHNLPVLMKGRNRCTLEIHPSDALRIGVADGGTVRLATARGSIEAPVVITADVMPGVVSLPHGWGHDVEGSALSVAGASPGVNSNALADGDHLDPLSGNAVLNGIPVELSAV